MDYFRWGEQDKRRYSDSFSVALIVRILITYQLPTFQIPNYNITRFTMDTIDNVTHRYIIWPSVSVKPWYHQIID